ncbi:MAG: endolytic transglycosylase MltG [Spirochaetae bacterium HGW-Spirochaetae-9]|nr:MAG: endolytic transglycosylase MltG [Spirochaetae bacterium HGW-Spirochaetae-9]
MKGKTLVLRILLIAFAVLLAATLFIGLQGLRGIQKKGEVILLRVEKGFTADDVASLLMENGLIRNRWLFRALLQLGGADRKLKAGTYSVETGTSMLDIIGMLSKGRTLQIQVTIPEGLTARSIGIILEKAGICSQSSFLVAAADQDLAKKAGLPGKNFEGFLFPDTYSFPADAPADTVVLAMARNFSEKLEKIAPGAMIDTVKLREKVILASIVEREYGVPQEAGLIASVFQNRLAIGMALQSCATVVYIITEKQGKPHPSVVYYADLAVQDPYNSYIHRGLPPGPISNPGETALNAVFNSPESDYLYFRLIDSSSRQHRFSKTFEEHAGETIPVKGF